MHTGEGNERSQWKSRGRHRRLKGSTDAIPNPSIYAATKGTLESATRVLAAKLGPRNIRVNAIAPKAPMSEVVAGDNIAFS